MPKSSSSSIPRATGTSARLIGFIRQHGWPLTKASYLRAMYSPEDPEFPLHPEDYAAIPADLPGDYLTELMDLFEDKGPRVKP